MNSDRKFVGRHLVYPDKTGRRVAEGGCRTTGIDRPQNPNATLVTVLTVCWNSARTIEQTINSVLSQTYRNIEYILVDGGSTDATVDIIRRYERKIDYFVSEPDAGLYFAMNKGLELAQGDLILILNSDDWYAPEAIESLVAAKDYSGCDFVGALAEYIDEETGKIETLRSMPFDDSSYLRMPLRHETMCIPASLYDRLGPYDTRYRILADREYAAKLFEDGATYYEVPRPLLKFRTSGISNTNTELLNSEKDTLLAAHFPFLTVEERNVFNDAALANPDSFGTVANTHARNTKLVKACKALLTDRKGNGGKKWKSVQVHSLIASTNSEYPKISVVLPFHCAENTIELAIRSVLEQDLKELELICIDDCAIDASRNIVEKYCRMDDRVRLIANEKNLGLGASRNAGIRAATGSYIFHLDPDDTIPTNALRLLFDAACKYGSDMVKGAYAACQGLHNKSAANTTIKYPCGVPDEIIAKTRLKESSRLLNTTEGHWSILYEANFARRTPYPTDLKMGQDSIFLVTAFACAQSVTLIPSVVYNYNANPASAMNNFNARKFMDAVEWRRRAWHILNDHGHREIGNRLLSAYWSSEFFEALRQTLKTDEMITFALRLRRALYEAQINQPPNDVSPRLTEEFFHIFHMAEKASFSGNPDKEPPLTIATFSTNDHGGAGTGSQRRVEALRNLGVDAKIHCVFKMTAKSYVHKLPLAKRYPPDLNLMDTRNAWRQCSVTNTSEQPGLKAAELFSKTGAVIDLSDVQATVKSADIAHFHWVVGLLDYAEAARQPLSDKPVVWTLADMNAFTGGCHYSEGCDGYRFECRVCPLLGAESDLAHRNWKLKKAAYSRIRNLNIICPSKWLAHRAAESSLLGDRPIHAIPNALPVDRFQPNEKLAVRREIGLPSDKKLIVFGADSLSNSRKGGDILAKAVKRLQAQGKTKNVEGLFFGANQLDIGIKAHKMGHISDERMLSKIFAAADVFAFPSREDNAPLTVAESLLSGTPVVAFPVGNVPEILNHKETGYIAKYLDIADFTSGLDWLLRTSDTREGLERSLLCAQMAREYNDPAKSARRQMHLYQDILARAKRSCH